MRCGGWRYWQEFGFCCFDCRFVFGVCALDCVLILLNSVVVRLCLRGFYCLCIGCLLYLCCGVLFGFALVVGLVYERGLAVWRFCVG